MFSFNFILYVTWMIINSSPTNDHLFARRDFYQSFSEPAICFEFFSDYPTPPPFLLINSEILLYYGLYRTTYDEIRESYMLNLIDTECNVSFIFKADKKYYDKINLDIDIYIYDANSKLASISYIFGRKYNTGLYKLYSDNNYFAMSAYILNDGQHVSAPQVDIGAAEYYINSLSTIYDDLCIVTHNNPDLFLRVKYYTDIIPNGLISQVNVTYVQNGNIINELSYTAFTCSSKEHSRNELVIIVDEEPSNVNVYFYAHLRNGKYNEKKFLQIPFQLQNVKSENVNALNHVQNEYKKWFLIKKYEKTVFCSNGTSYNVYLSQNGKIYYAYDKKYVMVSKKIKKLELIPLSLITFTPLESKAI